MLTEGWDARTVTHVMGLRAFSSQLLCEQVVGRGLRRTSYEVDPATGLFQPEHVNIFGIPFTFLPHEGGDEVVPPPPAPKSRIEPVAEKREFEMTWPNVVRIEHTWAPHLTLDWGRVSSLCLEASDTTTLAQLAPVVEGKPDVSRITEIDLEDLARRFRMQKIVFETARDVFDQMAPTWQGSREILITQLVPLVETFLACDRVTISPAVFQEDQRRRRILLTLNMGRIVRHLWDAIHHENTQALTPIFDSERPIRGTGDMLPWHTGRPWADTERSHINRCVFDSAWEASEAFRARPSPGRGRVGEERSPGLRDRLRVRRRRAQVPARLPHEAEDRHHARPGGQGPGLPAEPGQARRFGRMDARGDGARRLRSLAMGGVENAIRHRGSRPRGGKVTAISGAGCWPMMADERERPSTIP
jgi:type III restriction enzyme